MNLVATHIALAGLHLPPRLALFVTHWNQSGSWVAGDFNYDGVVNAVDLGALSSNWQQTLPSFAPVVTPEPVQTAAILLGASAFARRRRGARNAQIE